MALPAEFLFILNKNNYNKIKNKNINNKIIIIK